MQSARKAKGEIEDVDLDDELNHVDGLQMDLVQAPEPTTKSSSSISHSSTDQQR